MADPSLLTPEAVQLPEPELHDGAVIVGATEVGEEVTCVIPGFDPQLAQDPMPWTPYITPDGFFYPKRDDRVIVGFPVDGNPVILEWWPKATTPDETF